ncbi:MAG: hypothetical protein JRN20_02835 [Nitrososphaerota archaeon]|jgi:hypothetical protein|nr:hypothetical protein [Nitrososphaerota archaeon]MDG6923851.1 hypothetical protein [Nitrososphaerota archaeon]
MSRSEEITSEVRRLVLTCRSMEAQLQQSIPKKAHQEVVTKMQTRIDELTGDLERTKDELQKTTRLEDELRKLSEQITSQTGAITSRWESNDAMRIKELEERIAGMVDRNEYSALQARYEELKLSTVPKEDYVTLQNQFSNFVPKDTFEEMKNSFTNTTVPREQLAATEARMQELEAKIANSVPRADHDELISKLTSMIGEAQIPQESAQKNIESPLVVASS